MSKASAVYHRMKSVLRKRRARPLGDPKGPGSEEKFADSSYWRTKIRNRELLRSHRVEVLVQNLFDRILSIFA